MSVMPNLLSDLHEKSEQLKGHRLVMVLAIVIVVSLSVGILIDKATQRLLNNRENTNSSQNTDNQQADQFKEFEGKVVFVDPRTYPIDEISYYLADSEGNTIVLLKAYDEKLPVVEGLFVKVFGEVKKTHDNKEDILYVEKVIIRNGN